MDPGDILSRTWELYRAHWRHLIAIAAVIYVPLGGVSAALALIGWPGILAGNILNVAAIFLVQGALVKAVEDVRDGRRDLGVGATLQHAGGRLVTLTIAGVLAALGIIAGLALLIVPGLVLLTWWLVVSPVIMLESCGVAHGFGRSRSLVRGHAWPVFGVAVLTLLVLLAFSLALGLALTPLDGAARGFLQAAVGHTLAAPFAAVAWTLTYFRLRDAGDGGGRAGVWVTDRPDPGGGEDRVLFAVDVPEAVATDYEQPAEGGRRRFLLPADLLNRHGPPVVEGDWSE